MSQNISPKLIISADDFGLTSAVNEEIMRCIEEGIATSTVYCSNPRDFNDPWDCRPFFNTEILDDPIEREKHIDSAEKVCRKYVPMSEAQIGDMRKCLQDPIMLKRIVLEHTLEMQKGVLERFRLGLLFVSSPNEYPNVGTLRG